MPRRLAAAMLLALCVRAGTAWAGGNLQIRDPAEPSHIISTLWDHRRIPIHWVLSQDGLPGSGIGIDTVEAQVKAAFDTWDALPTLAVDFVYDGRVPLRDGHASGAGGLGVDGRNLVTFTDPDQMFGTGILALTLTTRTLANLVVTAANADLDGDGVPDLPLGTYPPGTILDADIAFNAGVPLAVSGAPGSFDVQAIALHEVGHFLGLCHSAIRHAVMFPFIQNDVLTARKPTADDVAWVSSFYPKEPAFSATFGSIKGKLTNGGTGLPILGGHVYTVDPTTRTPIVGGYTGDDGRYVLPGLVPGSYLVAIEPLDGDPPGTEPFRVNDVVASTLDVNFPDEFYDAHEGAVETDPNATLPVAVAAGAATTGIDIVTNTVTLAATSHRLAAGFNLLAWPVAVPAASSAFDLLATLGGPVEVASVDRYVPARGVFERAEHVDGAPAGVDFPLKRGEGYVVHMREARIVGFSGGTDCPALDLAAGLDLIGVPCPPPGYTAFALLQDLGAPVEVERVSRFDADAGVYRTASYGPGGVPQGDDFPVGSGEGFEVVMRVAKGGVLLPRPGRAVTPVLSGLSPGRGVPGTIVALIGDGFDPNPANDLVTFNGVPSAVIVATTSTLTAAVPGAATSGPVQVTVRGRTSNAIGFVVEPPVVTPPAGGSPLDVVPGQTVAAALTSDGQQDRYTFTARAGSVVTITATAVQPGVPDLLLMLENPYGAIVATDDNGGGGTDPRINQFALTATGTQTIVVTNVPGSGSGAYRLHLDIATRPAPTELSIIGGDGQTSEKGTALDQPLTVFATGPTGAPLAGMPVTFVTTEVSITGAGAPPGPAIADTTLVETNASGVVSIETTLPSTSGMFQIQVSIPGAPPVTFTVAATSSAIASVTMNGNLQHGPVSLPLPNPLEIVARDANGVPVPGALVTFIVASGGGLLTPASPARITTGPTGSASVVFRLGDMTSAPQVVAAVVPGRRTPLLFEAIPEAGAAAKIETPQSNYTRLSLNTDIFSALWVRVLDAAGNPVEGATVDYAAPPGMVVTPGIGPGGVTFSDFKTNADGIHVAAVGVPLKVAPTGDYTTDVLPTIDEFGSNIAGPYTVVASVAGGLSQTYDVDVDMGPRLATPGRVSFDGPMGVALAKPLDFDVTRVQRELRLGATDFRTLDFSRLILIGHPGAVVHLDFIRDDGEDETSAGLQPTHSTSTDEVTDGSGRATFSGITAGDVPGLVGVLATVPKLTIVFGQAGSQSVNFDGSPSLTDVALLNVSGPRIVLDVSDKGSGLDLHTVIGKLNATTFFNGSNLPLVLPTFPDRLELIAGARALTTIPTDFADVPVGHLTINYFPSLKVVQPTNDFVASQIVDRAGNQDVTGVQTMSFPWP